MRPRGSGDRRCPRRCTSCAPTSSSPSVRKRPRRARAGAPDSSRRPSSRRRRCSSASASRTSGPPTAGTCRRGPSSPGCRTSPHHRPRLRPATSRRSLARCRRSSSRASSATPTADATPSFHALARQAPAEPQGPRLAFAAAGRRHPRRHARRHAARPLRSRRTRPPARGARASVRRACAGRGRVDRAVDLQWAARRGRQRPAARMRALRRDALARAGHRRAGFVRAAADCRHDLDARQARAGDGVRRAAGTRARTAAESPTPSPPISPRSVGIARGFGESPEGAPWRADPHTGAPLEAAAVRRGGDVLGLAGTPGVARYVLPRARHLRRSLRALRDVASGRLLRLRPEPPPRAALGARRSDDGRRHRRRARRVCARRLGNAHAPGAPLVRSLVAGDAQALRGARSPSAPGPAARRASFAQRRARPRLARRRRVGALGTSGRRRARARGAQGQGARGAPRRRGLPAPRRARRLPAARRPGLARSRRGARGPRLGRTRRDSRRARVAAGGLAPRVGAHRERPARSRRGDLAARQSLRGSRSHHVVEPVLEPRAARLGSPRRDARRTLGRRDRAPALRQVVARSRGRAPAARALGLRRPRRIPPRDRLRKGSLRSRSTPSCARSARASSTRRAPSTRERRSPRRPSARSTRRR